jgi:hypothetical protein
MFEGLGVDGGECFDTIASSFLGRPTQVDASCVARMRPPAFQ